MFNDMDNMIDSVFKSDWSFPTRERTNWSPAVDVMEKDDSYIITADIPGLTKMDINVNISKDILSISGERPHDTDQDSNSYHYRERSRGEFVRSFNLPESVNEKKITANFKDGILTIELPKEDTVEPKARQIKIN
jgi:HSP20 family protein